VIHRIDPIIGSLFGLHFWWYGLSYSLGFLNAHLWLRRHRDRTGLSLRSVYELTICLAIGVIAGGRALVVFDHEWDFYRDHLSLIPWVWLGGMATHGLLAGGAIGVFAFCLWRRIPFRSVFDELAIAAAIIMGFGRLGNFIDGQIVGSVTAMPWAVKFPEAEGFRHPVVLYDGLKNFLLVPFLMFVRSRGVPPGRLAALFVFLYAGLRIPIDLLREYPVNAMGLPTGQGNNVIMAAIGAGLLVRNWSRARRLGAAAFSAPPVRKTDALPGWRRIAFALMLFFAMTIPSDATRDIPSKYGHRHPGLEYSAIYPPVDRK
jgi:phosphatidylglycerol:prolipoprotein diacylglycerol transferase